MRVMLSAGSTGFAALLFITAPVWFASAATIHVPSDQPTIQSGIDAAVAGDTVLVACDTYAEHDIAMTAGVTLRSATGDPECVTIDAGGLGRGILCESIGDEARIEGLTITGGVAGRYETDTGGGIGCIWSASPTISDCVFTGNTTVEFGQGGGLGCARSSDPLVQRCVFTANTGFYGAGFATYDAAPRLEECTFIGNQCKTDGGAAYFYDSAAEVDDCSFTDNSSTTHGGAIAITGAASPTVNNCLFTHNVAAENGGAIYLRITTLHVTGCTFSLGEARFGAALSIHQSSNLTLSSCTMTGNAASDLGGALLCQNNTQATLDHCIIAFGADGEAVYLESTAIATLSCCDLFGNAGGDWGPGIAHQLGVDGNVAEDPQLCSATPDTDGHWALQSDSPCAQAACGVMGAWPAACGTNAVLPASWGRIKSMMRTAADGGDLSRR